MIIEKQENKINKLKNQKEEFISDFFILEKKIDDHKNFFMKILFKNDILNSKRKEFYKLYKENYKKFFESFQEEFKIIDKKRNDKNYYEGISLKKIKKY